MLGVLGYVMIADNGAPAIVSDDAVAVVDTSSVAEAPPASPVITVIAPSHTHDDGIVHDEPAPGVGSGAAQVDDRLADPRLAATISQLDVGGPNWATAAPEDMEAHIGDTFSTRMPDGRMVDLVLTEVVASPPDPARPDFLPRKQSMTLLFRAKDSDMAAFGEFGARSVGMFHPDMGENAILLGVYPTEDGERTIEVILN